MKPVILFLTSYAPRKCGIAAYSHDLRSYLEKQFESACNFKVCALENGKIERRYPPEVSYILDVTSRENYKFLAKLVNANESISAVFVQHEFGLHGGDFGEYLLTFLKRLNKPVVTTFHTILPRPEKRRSKIVRKICKMSEKILIMTKNSRALLRNEYHIPEKKIEIIPHGTHQVLWGRKAELKERYDLSGRLVLSNFGLLSRNKGIETAIRALSTIRKKHPQVVYLLLGKTHPEVVKHEGESYREELLEEIDRLDLKDHVIMIGKYLELDELLDYLRLTDIYVLTSKDPNQAVSGTFGYAMASACPVISTAIPHARESLNEGSGEIIEFGNHEQLASAAIRMLNDPYKLDQMSRNAFHKTRATSWENAAILTMQALDEVLNNKPFNTFNLPPINLDHIRRLTTERGIIQFSDICIPDLASGYTLDDNARALIATTLQFRVNRSLQDLANMEIYLRFIESCQQQNGSFLNYVDMQGQFTTQNRYINQEDAIGRTVWALGHTIAAAEFIPDSVVEVAENILQKTLKRLADVTSPRAMAFAIKGLYFYAPSSKDQNVVGLIRTFADKLLQHYDDVSEGDWNWFEEYLTYANSTLPEAMLYAYLATKEIDYKVIARMSFDFLMSQMFKNAQIKVISNRGWYRKGEVPEKYGEQPIDVSYAIQTLYIFHKVFGDDDYRRKAEIAFSWFLGNNHLRHMIYNPRSGGCYDGLEHDGVNLNQGAESTVCYLMARLMIDKMRNETCKIPVAEVPLQPTLPKSRSRIAS